MSLATSGDLFISDLAKALDIPPERYEAADRSYRSVCDWLERRESKFFGIDIQAYTQGSFRLGTVIRPVNGEEDYDLDVVFEFDLSKALNTQEDVYDALGTSLSPMQGDMVCKRRWAGIDAGHSTTRILRNSTWTYFRPCLMRIGSGLYASSG